MNILNVLISPWAAISGTPSAAEGQICPIAPEGAIEPIDELTGYGLFGIVVIFGVAVLVAVGAIVLGKLIGMSHMSKGGVIALMVIFASVILYLTMPGVLDGMLGSACIPKPSSLT